jgi:hypothetical protein
MSPGARGVVWTNAGISVRCAIKRLHKPGAATRHAQRPEGYDEDIDQRRRMLLGMMY